MFDLRPKVYYPYSTVHFPVTRELFELGLLYERIFDGGGIMEQTIESSRLFANFMETGETIDLRTWDFGGLAVILLDTAVTSLRSQGVSDAIISEIFSKCDVIDRLDERREKDGRIFRDIVSDVAGILERDYRNVWQNIIALFKDLPLLKEKSMVEYSTFELRSVTHPAISDCLFEAVKLDEKDSQFRRIAHKADKANPVWWTAFNLNSSIMESSHLGMDLYMTDEFVPLLKYKFLRGARSDAEQRKRKLMQQSLPLLLPEIYDLDIPSYLEIRDSKDARLLRNELAKLVSSENIGEANLKDTLIRTYVKQLETIARARKPNLAHWLVSTTFSLVHPVAGLLISGIRGYKEIRDTLSDWRLSLTTLKLKEKTERYRSRRVVR